MRGSYATCREIQRLFFEGFTRLVPKTSMAFPGSCALSSVLFPEVCEAADARDDPSASLVEQSPKTGLSKFTLEAANCRAMIFSIVSFLWEEVFIYFGIFLGTAVFSGTARVEM